MQVPDVDSARMLLHIHGKSKKDRYVPLSESTPQLLRAHWRTHRSPRWLFPAPTLHFPQTEIKALPRLERFDM